jgi:hypothetical protein
METMRVRAWLIRRLGMRQCGAFGGQVPAGQRWCLKDFGHTDSCAYDVLPDEPISQPGFDLRIRFRGWTLTRVSSRS